MLLFHSNEVVLRKYIEFNLLYIYLDFLLSQFLLLICFDQQLFLLSLHLNIIELRLFRSLYLPIDFFKAIDVLLGL